MAGTTDASIVERCRAGERDAFRALFEAYGDRVYSMALYFFSGDEASARDITQGVFLKLFTDIRTFRGSAMFQTWLYRLVVNACMDEHRKRKRFVPFETVSEVEIMDSEESPESAHLKAEVSRSVREAVARLKPKLRLPVLLRYVEELPYAEIAAVLGCSTGTVSSRLNRAHQILARKLTYLAEKAGLGR